MGNVNEVARVLRKNYPLHTNEWQIATLSRALVDNKGDLVAYAKDGQLLNADGSPMGGLFAFAATGADTVTTPANGATEVIDGWTPTHDPAGAFNAGVVTVPNDGVYMVSGCAQMEDPAGAYLASLRLLINDVDLFALRNEMYGNELRGFAIVSLSAGDQLKIGGAQGSEATKIFGVDTEQFFSVVQMG